VDAADGVDGMDTMDPKSLITNYLSPITFHGACHFALPAFYFVPTPPDSMSRG